MDNTPLASWNDAPTKNALLDFIDRVTRKDSDEYAPPEERVAVFDNDGTLWCEKPMPIQADFLMRKIGEQAEQDASLRDKQPWKAVFEKDYAWLGNVITKHYQGDDSDLKLMAVGLLKAYQGATIEEFEATAERFLLSAQHPTLKRPYIECAYQPMIELLRYLESAGFTNYVATGGGRDFMRPITQDLYGIPMDRIIGSTVALAYRDNGPFADIVHKPEMDLFDDGPTKPVRIWSRIGRRPILACGNSNGDAQMLRFCNHPSRPSLGMLIRHDDDQREFAYDAGAEEVLKQAKTRGWLIASMKDDWRAVFAESAKRRAA